MALESSRTLLLYYVYFHCIIFIIKIQKEYIIRISENKWYDILIWSNTIQFKIKYTEYFSIS